MEFVEGGRRGIDRVLDDSFVANIAEMPIETLRERRNVARQEESNLSFLRRMLQGRIEVVELEIETFDHDSDGNLVDRITQVLSTMVGTAPENARITNNPSGSAEERRYAERLLGEVTPFEREDSNVERAADLVDWLRLEERSVSDFRTRVQGVVDSLTAELGGRYKSGEAQPPT